MPWLVFFWLQVNVLAINASRIVPRFGTPFCGDLFSKISISKVKIFLFLERVALSKFAFTLITSFLSKETFPFCSRVIELLPV